MLHRERFNISSVMRTRFYSDLRLRFMFRSVPEKNLSIGSVSQDPIECNPLGKPRWCAGGGGRSNPLLRRTTAGSARLFLRSAKAGRMTCDPSPFPTFGFHDLRAMIILASHHRARSFTSLDRTHARASRKQRRPYRQAVESTDQPPGR
jgi:hypothetical protein